MKIKSVENFQYNAFQSQKNKQKNNYKNSDYNTSLQFFPSNYNCKITNVFENYDSAQKIFRKNLKDGKGVFGSPDNIDVLIQNDKIRRNLVKFFAQYSQEQLDVVNSKKILTMDEVRHKSALIEVRNFFREYEDSWAKNETYDNLRNINNTANIAFAGDMTRKQEGHCKNIVHGFSAACGLVSAALGEGAAIGADTVPLRILQFSMFSTMAAYLNVPPVPSLEYYTKEMFAGATLGVGGARLVTSWLGIGGHAASVATGTSVATGGGTDAAITGGVRAVNSTLSTLITEKMGRGYINRVKSNRMTFKHQTIETLSYFAGRRFLTSQNPFSDMMSIDFKDSSSPELIKNALERIPKASQEAIAGVLDIAKELTSRAGTIFAINFVSDLLTTNDRSPEKMKAHAKAIFKQALIYASVYELCDCTVEDNIAREASETIKDMQENLEKYPEVYRVFVNAEHEFFEQINLDSLKSDAFTRQFKNKTFVHNLSNFSNQMVKEFSTAWVNRNRAKQAAAIKKSAEDINSEKQKSKDIDSIMSEDEKREVQKQMEELERIISSQKEYLKSEKGFGYGRIAGYENIKNELTEKFISPLSLQDTELARDIPNAILFYGPTGVGKSELARAIAEQGKCLMPRFQDPEDTQELKEELDILRKKAKEGARHSAIKIDEFDDYGSDTEAAAVFADFIKDCAQDKITLLLTTNNPLDIDKSILNQTLNIPISAPRKKDISEVLRFYLEDLSEEDNQIITQQILQKSGYSAYSNSQIRRMCNKAKSIDNSNLKENMIKLVNSTPPEISANDINKFNNETEELQRKK